MRWRSLPVVAFDTETTGLRPFAGDRIIEFAAVVLETDAEGRVVGTEEHSWLVNPGIPIPKEVERLTGISDADVAGAPPFDVIADEVWSLLAGKITVAHNYPFDMHFLTMEFDRTERHWPEPLAEVDTVDVSRKHAPQERSHRLEDVARRLGITLDNAHRATNDAEACGRAFLEFARRHEVPDDLQQMLDWADAIGRPPEDGPIGLSDEGRIVFLEGEHAGEPIGEHPLYLAWMDKARVKTEHGWQHRFPESTRRWARRWLDVRASGRTRPSPKSFRHTDWVLDSILLDGPDPRGRL